MKHAVILAHPKRGSFNAAIAQAYCESVEALGHRTLLRDLYALDFDPRMKSEELPFSAAFKPGEDVVAERAAIADADVFVLVYPLWLNSPPAILKGYLERVFGYGFAYGHDGHGSEPLLSGRKLMTFSSSGAPVYWVQQTGAFEAVRTLFDRHVAQVCGFSVMDHVHFGGIVPGIRPDAVNRMLEDVRKTAKTHFGANSTIPRSMP